jgi:hypothetical protein
MQQHSITCQMIWILDEVFLVNVVKFKITLHFSMFIDQNKLQAFENYSDDI